MAEAEVRKGRRRLKGIPGRRNNILIEANIRIQMLRKSDRFSGLI